MLLLTRKGKNVGIGPSVKEELLRGKDKDKFEALDSSEVEKIIMRNLRELGMPFVEMATTNFFISDITGNPNLIKTKSFDIVFISVDDLVILLEKIIELNGADVLFWKLNYLTGSTLSLEIGLMDDKKRCIYPIKESSTRVEIKIENIPIISKLVNTFKVLSSLIKIENIDG